MNIATYYFQKDGKILGPVTEQTLILYQRKGSISPTTLIRKKDSDEWVEFQSLITPRPAYFCGCSTIFIALVLILTVLWIYHRYQNSPQTLAKQKWERATAAKNTIEAPIGEKAYFNTAVMGTSSLDELKAIVISGSPYPASLDTTIKRVRKANTVYRFRRDWNIVESGDGYWVAELWENYSRTSPWTGKRKESTFRPKRFYIYSKAAEKHFSHAE